MAQSLSARAPGKVLICGEYAVLEQAPALVMAVDSYAQAQVQAGAAHQADTPFTVSISAADIGIEYARTEPWHEWENGQPIWQALSKTEQQQLQLVNAVLAQCYGTQAATHSLHLTLATPDFFDPLGQGKLGLGSSAALTVALTSALQQFNQQPLPSPQQAILAHRAQQQGRGSGVDIAASYQGGLLAFQWQNGQPHLTPVKWPESVVWRAIWVGKPASTGTFLAKLDAWRKHNPDEYQQRMHALRVCSEQIIASVQAPAQQFLALLHDYGQLLDALGQASGLDIVTAEHRQLMHLAQQYQVVYKTSGAGGGDIGLAFATEQQQLNEFLVAAQAQGFYVLNLSQSSSGLVIEEL